MFPTRSILFDLIVEVSHSLSSLLLEDEVFYYDEEKRGNI